MKNRLMLLLRIVFAVGLALAALTLCYYLLHPRAWTSNGPRPAKGPVATFERLIGRVPALRIVEPGGRLTSEKLDISSRTIVAVPPKPGVVFGTVRKLGGPEQFTFIVLFRYGPKVVSYDFTSQSSPGQGCLLEHFGRWGETRADFAVNDGRIDVGYRVELDDTLTAVVSETLTVGGNPVDLESGQVFVVDLKATPPVYRQIKAQFPPVPDKFETDEDAQRAADHIRQSLEKQNLGIERFLR